MNYLLCSTGLTLDRIAVDLDPIDPAPATLAPAAAGHQIREPDLIHFAQIRMLLPDAIFIMRARRSFGNFVDVQLAPANPGRPEFAFVPIRRPAFGILS